MSEDQPVEAETATPETGTPSEELYQKRYSDLRPEYDRTQNELHQARSELLKYTDPDNRRSLVEEWGYTVDEGEPEYTESYEDPAAAVREELASLKQEWQNFTAQQQQQAAVAAAEAYSEQKLDSLGIENERQREWIVSRAAAMPALQHEGFIVPDVEAAHAEYKEFVSEMQSSWAQSKKEAPFTPAGGQENTGVPAWSDDADQRANDRQQSMLERLRSLQD